MEYVKYQKNLCKNLNELLSLNYLVLDTYARAFPGDKKIRTRENLPMPTSKRQDVEFSRLQNYAEERVKRFNEFQSELNSENLEAIFFNLAEAYLDFYNSEMGMNYGIKDLINLEDKIFDFPKAYKLGVLASKSTLPEKTKDYLIRGLNEVLIAYVKYDYNKEFQSLTNAAYNDVTEYGTKSENFGKDYFDLIRIDNKDLMKFMNECNKVSRKYASKRNEYILSINKHFKTMSQIQDNDDMFNFFNLSQNLDGMDMHSEMFRARMVATNTPAKVHTIRNKITDKIVPPENPEKTVNINKTTVHYEEFARYISYALTFTELKEQADALSLKYLGLTLNDEISHPIKHERDKI